MRTVTPAEIKALDYALRYSTIEHDYGCASVTGWRLGPCSCPAKDYRDQAIDILRRLGDGLRKPSGDYIGAPMTQQPRTPTTEARLDHALEAIATAQQGWLACIEERADLLAQIEKVVLAQSKMLDPRGYGRILAVIRSAAPVEPAKPRARSLVCSIGEHAKCDGHVPEGFPELCACSCHSAAPVEPT